MGVDCLREDEADSQPGDPSQGAVCGIAAGGHEDRQGEGQDDDSAGGQAVAVLDEEAG